MLKVSLDGGETFVDAPEGVRIIVPLDFVPSDGGSGQLHVNFTDEGIIKDIWSDDQEPGDDAKATSSETYYDAAKRVAYGSK